MRHIVISAVNLRKGGTLTVLRDCLDFLSRHREEFEVTAFVHARALCDFPGIRYIEIPWSARGWLRRLWCEYVTLGRLSRRLPCVPDLWLSLHDTTPRVRAKRQVVYCQTSFPFLRLQAKDWGMDAKVALFALLTRHAYRWNVRRNRYLIAQAQWFRKGLSRLTGMEEGRVIVAPPSFRPMDIPAVPPPAMYTFLCVATPDAHKNFETLCRAASLLERRVGKGRFRVALTLRGDENRYARWLRRNWGDVSSLDFRGLLSREALAAAYGEAHCLVFPSRVETWGLPITEFLPTGKPMLLADLPYAHETAAGADKVAFFPATQASVLAQKMQAALEGLSDLFHPVERPALAPPVAKDWDSLFRMLLA